MASRGDASTDFTFLSFLWRLLATLVLVLVTFNPSGYSAFHWIKTAISEGNFGPVHALAIVGLLIGWVIVWVATWRALDTLGVVLASVALACFVWLLVDIGWLHTNSMSTITWVVLVCLAVVLAIGMCWSHVWRRLTGQLNVEDTDE